MKATRQIAIVLIAIVMVTGLYYGVRSYDWTVQLNVPKGVRAESVTFSCAPLFASDYVHGPTKIDYPLASAPCGVRQQYQIMDGADLGGGALALGALLVWPMRRRHAQTAEPAPAA